MEGGRVKASGKSAAAGRNSQVVCPCKTGNAVQQYGYIFLLLHETFRTLNDHLRNTFMMLRKFIKGGVDHFHIFSPNRFFDVCNLFRTFVDQEDQKLHIGVIL